MNLKICHINMLVSMTRSNIIEIERRFITWPTPDCTWVGDEIIFKSAKINVCFLRSHFFGIALLVQAEAIQFSFTHNV